MDCMNYRRYLNEVSLARRPSPIRVMTDLLMKSSPSMISLHAGSPNPDLYPFKSAQFKLKGGDIVSFDEDSMRKILTSGATQGEAVFVKQLRELQTRLHRPPTLDDCDENGGRDIQVTQGSQQAICMFFEMLISRGDYVLVDNPTYCTALSGMRPLGCKLLPVDADHHGTIPDSLRKVLSRWTPLDAKDPNSDIPRILYSVPNGMNPTGMSLTLERKKEIYQIAREYGILILEDDPYYFLQFCQPRIPTFLSMDEDGRVVRFDSFSKIFSIGLRVGFVTGPIPLVDMLRLHEMVSVTHIPGINQMLISELLRKWGPEGLENHTGKVRDFYKGRKDATMKSADRWLTGLAEWNEPAAGLFLWIKLKGVKDSKKLIMEKALKKEVMALPGSACMADEDAPCPYVRVSYAQAPIEDIDKAMERLADLLKEETPRV